jgi:hypothetical protein
VFKGVSEHFVSNVKQIIPVDVRGSVHHSTIHKKNPTRCNNVSKFYYSIFI